MNLNTYRPNMFNNEISNIKPQNNMIKYDRVLIMAPNINASEKKLYSVGSFSKTI